MIRITLLLGILFVGASVYFTMHDMPEVRTFSNALAGAMFGIALYFALRRKGG